MAEKGRRWILKTYFNGPPQRSDFIIEEFDIPELKNGEILLEAVVFSVDPYMRLFARKQYPIDEGQVMMGEQVARVLQTMDNGFSVGEHVLVKSGWSTHTVTTADKLTRIPPFPEGISLSCALGGLGMPGKTAYIALSKFAKMKAGDTVFVNSAAGAVGSIVGQLAKLKGCHVIGSAGTDEKVKYIKEQLGFDAAFNYKTVTDVDDVLKSMAPDGIDIFFENVGGEGSVAVFNNMKLRGKVIICGGLAEYNATQEPKVTSTLFNVLLKRLTVQGFVIYDHEAHYDDALTNLIQLRKEGKIKFPEKEFHGFDKLFEAFTSLFTNDNIGKVVVYAK